VDVEVDAGLDAMVDHEDVTIEFDDRWREHRAHKPPYGGDHRRVAAAQRLAERARHPLGTERPSSASTIASAWTGSRREDVGRVAYALRPTFPPNRPARTTTEGGRHSKRLLFLGPTVLESCGVSVAIGLRLDTPQRGTTLAVTP
jgi:hypothetical protein